MSEGDLPSQLTAPEQEKTPSTLDPDWTTRELPPKKSWQAQPVQKKSWRERFEVWYTARTPNERQGWIVNFGRWVGGLLGGLLLFSVGALQQCSSIKGENTELRRSNSTQAANIEKFRDWVHTLTTENGSLKNQLATYSTVPFQAATMVSNINIMLAQNPTNQQQLLSILYSVQSLTNALTAIAAQPTFSVKINDTELIQGAGTTVIRLPEDRAIRLQVKNTSVFPAEQLTVFFWAEDRLSPTNLTMSGEWRRMELQQTLTIQNTPYKANTWIWNSKVLLGSTKVYAVDQLTVASNCDAPLVRTYIEVLSNRAKDHRYFVIFIP